MVGVERGLGEKLGEVGVAGWWCLSRLVCFCDGKGDGRLEMGDGKSWTDIERERERLEGHDGKITECCSLIHIPSKSRSGSRW
jgi:hypothetical protein